MKEDYSDTNKAVDANRKSALRFIVLLGFVSLFADMTYEGARSITGPFLGVLGASATIVGIVAGLGEFIGYCLRLVSGYFADKTGKYWTLTILGYAINLLAVPALALAGRWEFAALLIVAERFGKAVRSPAKDAMLSHATSAVGRGWGFALHEAMDQVGAVLGPVIVAAGIYFRDGYRTGFAVLLVPALIALAVLVLARFLYPSSREFETRAPKLDTHGFRKPFWIYMAAVACIAAGYADFPLIAFHFQKTALVDQTAIPLFYAAAMGVDAISALVFGWWFDRKGIITLIAAAVISAFFAPLVFLGNTAAAKGGMIVWGIGMGAQESVLKAAVAEMTPPERRGTAYGLFNTGYGMFWFLGSALMGFLYDVYLPALIAFSMLLQLSSIPFFLFAAKKTRQTG